MTGKPCFSQRSFEIAKLIRRQAANSIRARSQRLPEKAGCMAAISASHHDELSAWQTGATMYERINGRGSIAEMKTTIKPTRLPMSASVLYKANTDGVLLRSFQVSYSLSGGFLRLISHTHIAVLNRSTQAFDASI